MEKLKWVCDYSCDGTNLSFEKDRAYGFSWPQRNYRCSFCKKEFKSAQALGGHMNVHRRDRARLRLSPSWDCSNPNPNPNPNSNPSFPQVKFLPNYINNNSVSSFAAVINSAPMQQEKAPEIGRVAGAFCCRGDVGKRNEGGGMIDLTRVRKDNTRVWKGNELIRLDLNLGLLQDVKEDLDLELRLGYSN